MLETRAVVVALEGEYALVEVTQPNGCSQCNGQGCGSAKVAQVFCSKPRVFRVQNTIQASIGSQVIVTAPDGVVLHGVFLVYLVPLLVMFLFVLLTMLFTTSEPMIVVVALLGLMLGFIFSRRLGRVDQVRYLPVITRAHEI